MIPIVGRVEGKVAFLTGAARGIGRSTAVRLAEEGARIVATDICRNVETVNTAMGSHDDLDETARLIEEVGGEVLTISADVRDQSQLDAAVSKGLSRFGAFDIVVANAGVLSSGVTWQMSEEQWKTVLDVNLSGVWRTCKATLPSMLKRGEGGAIVITSSTGAVRGFPNLAHYTASKHGTLGLMKALAAEVAPHSIRVNAVLPTVVETHMSLAPDTLRGIYPEVADPTREAAAAAYSSATLLPIDWLAPRDVSNAILWLASDEARHVTATALPVDGGALEKNV